MVYSKRPWNWYGPSHFVVEKPFNWVSNSDVSCLSNFFQGVLCDCEVGVIAYNAHNGKLFEYSSVDMEQVLERYASYTGPSPRRKRENVSVA